MAERTPEQTEKTIQSLKDQAAQLEATAESQKKLAAVLNDSAEALAKYVEKKAPDDIKAQVTHALHNATHRKPTDQDIQDGLDLIKDLKANTKANQEDAMHRFCLLVLNLNEFLYLD